MALIRSDSVVLREAKGSRPNGAPALAASRCQAMASAKLRRGASNIAWALTAQSAAICSWARVRRTSSSFSRNNLAAPLSLTLISL